MSRLQRDPQQQNDDHGPPDVVAHHLEGGAHQIGRVGQLADRFDDATPDKAQKFLVGFFRGLRSLFLIRFHAGMIVAHRSAPYAGLFGSAWIAPIKPAPEACQ